MLYGNELSLIETTLSRTLFPTYGLEQAASNTAPKNKKNNLFILPNLLFFDAPYPLHHTHARQKSKNPALT
jgi:hypothetical protein